MRQFLSACAIAIAPVIPAEANELVGTFRTEPVRGGGVLHVTFDTCQDDAEKTCGVINDAYHKSSEPRTDYPHLGRTIIWDMEYKGRGKYSGGQLWAPGADKVLQSKLLHRGNKLSVSGCVGPICRSEVWVRLKQVR